MDGTNMDDIFGTAASTPAVSKAAAGPIVAAQVAQMAYAGGGRGVVATVDLQAGQLIAIEWPVLEWPGVDHSDPASLVQVAERIFQDPAAWEVSKQLYPQDISMISDELNDLALLQSAVVPADELHRLLLVLKHNGFESGLYLSLCMFNHSCDPNCIKYSPRPGSRGASEIWTVRPVAAGEELLVSYAAIESSSTEIRRYLQSQHSFSCHCSRCEAHITASEAVDEDYVQLVQSIEQGLEDHADMLAAIPSTSAEPFCSAIADIQEVLLAEQLVAALQAHGNVHLLAVIYQAMVSAAERYFQIIDKLSAEADKASILMVLQCWLNASVHLLLVQCEYLGQQHPALTSTYTDISNCMESIRRLYQDKDSQTKVCNELEAYVKELSLSCLEGTDTAAASPAPYPYSTALQRFSKQEAARLKDLYHAVKRCQEVAFIRKKPGLTYWGKVQT